MIRAATALGLGALVAVTGASAAPVMDRLIQPGNLVYAGAFRLPAAAANGDDFSYGGSPIAYNPAGNTLFVGSQHGRVAEVSIPAPADSADAGALPVARYVQPFADPTEGHLRDIASSGVVMDGLLVFGRRLYGTGFVYYDATNAQRVSHFSRSLTLAERSFRGMFAVGEKGKSGFVSGYLSTVPPEWQARLGGEAITGLCCIPIVSRTSWGPDAFAWSPADLGSVTPLPVIPLLYYTADHATLGVWSGSSSTFGATTQIGGVVIIAGTRSALFVGRNGTGPYCYGSGISDRARAGRREADGDTSCYDPTNVYKGPHAYPYSYQVWAYDLNDLAAVKAKRKKPWEPTPYAVWPLELPGAVGADIGGIGYDAAHQYLYVSQKQAEHEGYAYRPLIHVFHVQ